MDNRLLQRSRKRSPFDRTRTRAHTWDSDLEVNYDKLKELCAHFTPNERIDHEDFMKQYPSIFKTRSKKTMTTLPLPQIRPHTCPVPSREYDPTAVHDIRPFIRGIHGREIDKKEKASINLSTRLHKMLAIARKLPLQRSQKEVCDLAEQLMATIPSLPYDKTISKLDFYTGLAQRAILESIHSAGYALPGKGGLYLILRGSVEKLDKSKREILSPGECFGKVGSHQESELTHLVKHMYPQYNSMEACMLLRINGADYYRVAESCKKSYREEKQRLIRSCGLLYAVSPSILNRLADTVTTEEVQENTVVISQDELIDRVWFIKEGKCTASVKVPGSPKNLEIIVGELNPGDCIGEVVLLGSTETQPYTVTTSTCTTLGCVSLSTIRATELHKHILSDRKCTLPSLTVEEIRESYVQGAMDEQWSRIKEYVIDEITTERGIQFGAKKWQHSPSQH